MSQLVRIEDLAREIGVTGAQVLHTVFACRMPYSRFEGGEVSPEIAEQLRSIYRNASQPTQEPRPTPWRLREEFAPGEEHTPIGPDRPI